MATGAGTRTSTAPGATLGDDWLACAKSGMAVVASSLTEAPFGPALEAIEDFRGELNAVEALLMAQRKRAGFSDRSTESILKNSGKVSKDEAKRRTKRSNAIGKNPGLANKMSSGEISTEHVDLVADAAAQTGGEAAADTKLIEDIAGANPDQGKAIVRDYVDNHQSQGERDSRYAKQRKRRKAYKGRGANGMSTLIIEGDDNSIDTALANIRSGADRMYREAGGRDVPNDQHPRTHNQRMFDAAMLFLTGSVEPAAESASPAPNEPASTGPTPMPSAKSAPRKSASATRPTQRPIMVFRSDISEITNDPAQLAEWTAELIGTGLVPSTLASYYRCISDHVAQLVDGEGAVLWQGRASRRVSPEQWVALVIRDRGCVDCGAHHSRCEAHHVTPWNAPAKGETNIDELVLLCVDCHHRLHEANFALEFDPYLKKWLKRPATWAETPGSGPPGQDRRRSTKPENRAASNSRSAKAQLSKN